MHNFNPNGPSSDTLNTLIPTFAFNHVDSSSITCLGPSLAWQFGHQVHTEVLNNLDQSATVHWHGAHVPTYTDGGPHQRIPAGDTWKIDFEIKDKSATMWYHPHVMDHTYEQVQMGMSGMLYVEDPDDEVDDPILVELHQILPHDYNINDFPIIVQTKKFYNDNGQMRIDSFCCGPPGQNGYKDNYKYVINSVINPFLVVSPAMIRLRILNGDAKFAFNLGIGDVDLDPMGFEFIATDAGYTNQSYHMNEVLMAPGERTEWLLDLRGYQEGDTLYLVNWAKTIPTGVIGDSTTTKGWAKDEAILKFIIGPDIAPPSPIISFPIPLYPLDPPPFDANTKRRTKTFYKEQVGGTGPAIFNINHVLMDMMVVNDTVMVDSTEIWKIVNTTNIAHPWHIHDIHFYVTEILDANGMSIDPNSMPHIFKGPLDNVLVMPGWELSWVTTFSDFGTQIAPDSTYMFHCHILPHEDKGMMGQFVVWNGVSTVDTDDPLFNWQNLTLFPNPASGYINLEGSSTSESLIRIINVQGKVLRTQTLPAFDGLFEIPLDGLENGLLFFEWQSAEGIFVDKVLKY